MKKILGIIAIAAITMSSFADDVIVTKDAQKINAKIEEVAPTEIKYKKANSLNGPTFVLPISDILCIIFENDEVMIFEEEKKQDIVQKPEIYLTQEEIEMFDGIPRKLVAIEGDYSMLYDKNALVFFDVNCDNTCIVKFTHFDGGIETWAFAMAGYNNQFDFQSLDLSETYKNFNESPIFPKKCYLVPYSDLTKVKEYQTHFSAFYKLELRVRFLDIGNSMVSSLTKVQGDAGGAVIYGELVITDMATNREVGRILVDRIKGKNSPFAHVRLERAISTMLMPELFHIKKK